MTDLLAPAWFLNGFRRATEPDAHVTYIVPFGRRREIEERAVSEHREFKDIAGPVPRACGRAAGRRVHASSRRSKPRSRPRKNLVWERVADGTLSEEFLKRLCKEYYFLGKWYTTEFGSIVSNAPDVDALDARHQRALHPLGAEPRRRDGFRGDRNHVDMKIDWARQLGHLRRGARLLPRHARVDRLGVHDALLHAPLVRGGAGRLRLGGRAVRRLDQLRR